MNRRQSVNQLQTTRIVKFIRLVIIIRFRNNFRCLVFIQRSFRIIYLDEDNRVSFYLDKDNIPVDKIQ